jgi:uncharacterized protein
LAVAGLGLDAFWLEPASLRVTEHVVALNDADRSALAGLRIAVITDLHGGSRFIDADKIRRVVALTNAAKPDLVLLVGDYEVSSPPSRTPRPRHIPIEAIARLLAPLSAPLGVYAVLGNHDRWYGASEVASALQSAHIVVLDNQSRLVSASGRHFYLVGVGDTASHATDLRASFSAVPAGATALCFTHSPDIFPNLPATCALTIAGHTHGGQVDLPFVGRLVVPSRFGQRYAAGIVREGAKTLFVSTGIGTSILPIRFGVPPEISLLSIR